MTNEGIVVLSYVLREIWHLGVVDLRGGGVGGLCPALTQKESVISPNCPRCVISYKIFLHIRNPNEVTSRLLAVRRQCALVVTKWNTSALCGDATGSHICLRGRNSSLMNFVDLCGVERKNTILNSTLMIAKQWTGGGVNHTAVFGVKHTEK